jgi:Ca-activated chloride channel family protein
MVVSSITGGMRRVNPSADLDEETLTKIAELTGGQYFRAKDTAGLQQIYRLLDDMEPVAEPEAGFRPVKSLYFWPLGGAFVLASFLAVVNLLAGLRLNRLARIKFRAG